jgi:hypothetical protein
MVTSGHDSYGKRPVHGLRCRLRRRVASAIFIVALAAGNQTIAAPADSSYTMGNYPVEASAKDAVTARDKAVADGQRAAFRSLLKRLVPVTSYARLKRLAGLKVGDMVDGVVVKSERNSSTDYLANLDFIFQPQAVRAVLQKEGLRFVDMQAPQLIVVPIWRASPETAASSPQLSDAAGGTSWMDAWKSLDLTHALTPIKLDVPNSGLKPPVIESLSKGEASALRQILIDYKTDTIIFAIAEPDVAKKRLHVTLVGRDEVGDLGWRRSQRLDFTDLSYTVEVAAVVSLGVLEGRWKAMQLRGGRPQSIADAAAVSVKADQRDSESDGNFKFAAEFRGMGEWQTLSRRLAETPGVEDIDVAGLSARGARVSLRYTGTMNQLADALNQQGMALRNTGAGWVLSAQ